MSTEGATKGPQKPTMIEHTKTQLIDMFLDRTTDESTRENRLITRSDEGNVSLVAYGWLKLAVYNESRDAVTVFTGHAALRSDTVNRYLDNVIDRAESRGRDVIISGESPIDGMPNEGVKYINNYISMDDNYSAVEQEAKNEVIESLAHLA